MKSSGVVPWIRTLVVAGLAAAAVHVATPAARAEGCHAPDRPAVGLDFHWQADASAISIFPSRTAARRPPRVAPIPCQGQSPATVDTEVTGLPALPPGDEAPGRPGLRFRGASTAELPAYLPPDAARLDRPPRPGPPA